ncbi:DUF6252 family protein [Croceiramulus getboli]|nr:DUF6252 family protein [Flavobacteriaceae bacterium YJPT1-3]
MKLLQAIAAAALCCLVVTSCEPDDSAPQQVTDGKLVATVEGESFSASPESIQAAIIDGALVVIATDMDSGTTIQLNAQDLYQSYHDLGEFHESVATYKASRVTTFTTSMAPAKGEIIITDINLENSTVSGTFMFAAFRTTEDLNNPDYEQMRVTEGAFSNLPVGVIPAPEQ